LARKTGLLLMLCALFIAPAIPASEVAVTVYQHCGYEGYRVHLPPGDYSLRDLLARGVRDNDVSSIRVSRGYSVKLFKRDGFQGRYHPLTSSDECLAGSDFDNKASSISVSEARQSYPREYHSFGVTVYQDCNYGGYAVHLPPGDYSLEDLRARDVRNDDVASIRVSRGYEVTIYEHDGFQGRSRTLTRSDDCLLGSGLYEQISSISVSQAQPHSFPGFDSFGVTVYEQCGYAGHAVQLPAGNFSLEDLRARDVRNDDVSSIKVPRGFEVTVYEHDGFQGRSLTLTENEQCLSNSGFTDNISSISVSQVQPASGGAAVTCGSQSGP
jgi:hypothetical protein